MPMRLSKTFPNHWLILRTWMLNWTQIMVQGFITSSTRCKIPGRIANICIQLLGWHQMDGITDFIPWQDRFAGHIIHTCVGVSIVLIFLSTDYILLPWACSLWKKRQTNMVPKLSRWTIHYYWSLKNFKVHICCVISLNID